MNLVGVHAAKIDPIVITYFGTVESIYLFFSRSTLRWEQLKNAVKITVKREAETRWSSKAEAVKAISEGVTELVELLESLSDDINQTMDTRNEAGILLQNIDCFASFLEQHSWKSRPRSKTTTRYHNEL